MAHACVPACGQDGRTTCANIWGPKGRSSIMISCKWAAFLVHAFPTTLRWRVKDFRAPAFGYLLPIGLISPSSQ